MRMINAGIAALVLVSGCAPDRATLTDQERGDRVASMFAEESAKFDAPVLSLEKAKQSDDLVIVDARTNEERRVSMIPGAITKEEYEADPDRFSGKAVATYCTIGYRSGAYAEALRARGVEAYNLEGSILGWIHAGNPVVNDKGDTVKRVHVYGDPWNLAPQEYETEF